MEEPFDLWPRHRAVLVARQACDLGVRVPAPKGAQIGRHMATQDDQLAHDRVRKPAAMAHRGWFPDSIVGELVVLRRHVPANLSAFRRWYADPQVARLTRYQDGPMSWPEIERFFHARVLGQDSLALAIHVRATSRLIGTCALSQLDGDNGSALFHITI